MWIEHLMTKYLYESVLVNDLINESLNTEVSKNVWKWVFEV